MKLEAIQLGVAQYTYADLVRRIQALVEQSGSPLKAIQDAVGIAKDQWSRKMRVGPSGEGGVRTSFTLSEITRLSEFFRAPPGWPFVDWEVASANSRALEALAASRGSPDAVIPSSASHSAQPGKRRARGAK